MNTANLPCECSNTRSSDDSTHCLAARMVYAVARDFPSAGSFKPAVTPRPIHVLIAW